MKKKILNNWQLKLAVLIFAIIFWRLIGEVANPVTTATFRNIPVTMINEEIVTDKGKVYQVVNSETTVTVVVTATTSVLRQISEDDIVAVADFENIILSELIPISISITGFQGAYQSATVNPVNVQVSIEDSTSKKFPIVPSAIGTMSSGYALGEMTLETETVTISGPESIIDSISRVEAQVNITDVTSDSTLSAELLCYDEDNLLIDQTLLTLNLESEAEVKVNVSVLDSKSLTIDLETSGEPEDGYQLVSITSEPTEILVAGKQEILDEIDILSIPGSALDITGESGKVDRVVDISQYLPEGIQLYDENNNLIAVTIQIDELGTKSIEIPVLSIVVYDNPEGLTLSYNNVTDIMLSFTALDDVLEELDSSDVRLSIDLKSYTEAGEYDVPVMVTTIDGCELVEEVTVPIILTEKVGEEDAE